MNIMDENAHEQLKLVLDELDGTHYFDLVYKQSVIRVLIALVYAILGISSELRNKK